MNHHQDTKMENTDKLKDYCPLFSLIAVTAVAGTAVAWHTQDGLMGFGCSYNH